MPYRLSPLAEGDLTDAWLYVADNAGMDVADGLIENIVRLFSLLVENPRMGRARPEFGEGVRSFVVDKYVIYYRHDSQLLIARVLHASRDAAAAWSTQG